ncbi:MAG: alkaline phosphatase D family protein [Bacteroidetes bacterium]|nr:alkaline phosphatase D family protein [Bacteroidota bacterium]MCW5895651.1 alkaline phosphatase D family protein [Bacteroidota bacterium]
MCKQHSSLVTAVMFILLKLSAFQIVFAANVTNAIVVGGVTESSARFWVRISGPGTVQMQLSQTTDFSSPILSSQESALEVRNYAAIVSAQGLQADRKYYYRALVDGVPHTRIGSFYTFPSPGTASNFTFAFGSCQQGSPFVPSSGRGGVFREVVRAHPKFFLQIGDWGYPDTTDNIPEDSTFFSYDYSRVQSSYLERTIPGYPMDSLMLISPVNYVYDDHDFLNNNSSATTASFSIPVRPSPYGDDFIAREILAFPEGRLNSIRGYKENMPTYPLVNESRGIYHKFTYGNVDVFMLDLRAQRSPNQESLRKNSATQRWEFVPPAGHSIIGRTGAPGSGQSQLDWFLGELQASTATWKFVTSTVPFNVSQIGALLAGIFLQDSLITLPGVPIPVSAIFAAMELTDKWCGFPQDAQAVLDFVNTNNIKNVIVLSGDQHTAAIDDGANAGFPEIMAGGLDITNSRIVALFEAFGLHIWNKGGQGITTNEFNNAYGKINVFGEDSVQLQLIDEFGTMFATHTVLNQLTTGAEEASGPSAFALLQNFPNPFNSTTTIRFNIPHVQTRSLVTLKVYDVLGRDIATLVNEVKEPGTHTAFLDATNLASGVYYYRLKAGENVLTKKMVLLR